VNIRFVVDGSECEVDFQGELYQASDDGTCQRRLWSLNGLEVLITISSSEHLEMYLCGTTIKVSTTQIAYGNIMACHWLK
jgi:hypothetical protein